jgi:hypothetical protein
MEWVVILACVLLLMVFATFPPRTEKWRRARKRFWRMSALAAILVAINGYLLDAFGTADTFVPGAVWLGALFVLAVVTAVWLHAAQMIHQERSQWRRNQELERL